MYQGYILKKKKNRRPIDEIAPKMKLLQKNKIKNNLNTELTKMGVFSAVAGNQLPNQLQKRVLPALFHLRCPSQSPTFSPWTHTSDDSYIYQLSLVLATATVSL